MHTKHLLLVLAAAAGGFALPEIVAAGEPSVVVAGSERMAPLVRALAERYTELHPDVKIEVSGGGSAAGIEKLVDGTAMLASVARPVTEDELRRAESLSRTNLVGIPVAMDAVVFFVNRRNGLASVTLDQLEQIFRHKVETWEELGLPYEEPIERHMLPQGSGSVRVLQTRAMHGKAYTSARNEHEVSREVVNTVAANVLALGFGGRGYTSGVDIVPVRKNANSPPVLPEPAAIRDRTYPLAHYLYFYFAGQPTGHAKDFLRFVLSPEGQRIVSHSPTGALALPMAGAEE